MDAALKNLKQITEDNTPDPYLSQTDVLPSDRDPETHGEDRP